MRTAEWLPPFLAFTVVAFVFRPKNPFGNWRFFLLIPAIWFLGATFDQSHIKANPNYRNYSSSTPTFTPCVYRRVRWWGWDVWEFPALWKSGETFNPCVYIDQGRNPVPLSAYKSRFSEFNPTRPR